MIKNKLSLVSILSLLFISNSILCVVANYESDYEKAGEKLYLEIDRFNFMFEGSPLTYIVKFGAMMEDYNETHIRIVCDILVFTATQEYVSNCPCDCIYQLNYSYGKPLFSYGGIISDSTSFLQFGDDLYNYTFPFVFLKTSLLPKEITFSLQYELSGDTGSAFDHQGTYSTSYTFYGSAYFATLYLMFGIAVVAGVVGIIVVVVIVKKRRSFP